MMFLFIFLFPFSEEQQSNFIIQKNENNFVLIDDFSSNPVENWILMNAAYWDSELENMVLTEPGSDLVGVMWLKNNISSNFSVEFDYKIGGGSGADGMVFMFYKDWDYKPGIGGFLGFHCRDVGEVCLRDNAPGYGIEFDNYYNSKKEYGDIYGEGDPSPSHIALIKDFIGNHITYVNDSRTNDNIWHHVKVVINDENIILFIDEEQTLVWNGPIDRSNNHLGFGSGIWGYDHKHIIDNFKVYGDTIILDGLDSGWKVEFISDSSVISESIVLEKEDKVELDVSIIDFPIQGNFKIYNESKVIFVSSIFDEIWGGEKFSLISNLENNIISSSTNQTNLKTTEDNLNLSIELIIGFTSVILLFIIIIIYWRKK